MRFEGDGNREWFSHGGSNTGTGGHVMASMQDGKAIIVFGNGPSPIRIPVINQIKASIIAQLGWEKPLDKNHKVADESVIKAITGRYQSEFEHIIEIVQEDELLIKNLHGQNRVRPLVYLQNGRFGMTHSNIEVGVEQGQLTFYRKHATLIDQSMRKLSP